MRAPFIILASAIVLLATPAFADQFVNGYFRQNGTYVQPHYRSSPDSNPFNNYSTQGNMNPHTFQSGTQNPYGSYSTAPSPTYGAPPTQSPYLLR